MAVLLYGLMCLIWGSTWLAIKVGLDGVPPFYGAGLRFLVAAAIVAAVVVARRRRPPLTRDDVICIGSLGVLVFWWNYALVYWAELRISSGLTAVLFSTMPLTTALLSRFWMRSETISGRRMAGIAAGMLGTAVLFWPQGGRVWEQVAGMAAALGASVCSSVSLVIIKRHATRSDPFVLNLGGMGIGAVCLLGMSALFERSIPVRWTPSNVTAIVYLAVCGSVVAFSLYYRLVKLLDATTVSMSTLIIPIIALVLGHLFLGETITSVSVAGIVTILVGVTVAITPAHHRRLRRPPESATPNQA